MKQLGKDELCELPENKSSNWVRNYRSSVQNGSEISDVWIGNEVDAIRLRRSAHIARPELDHKPVESILRKSGQKRPHNIISQSDK